MSTSSGSTTAVHPGFVIALSNISPYFKHMSAATAAKMIQLVGAFANPTFVLCDEGHPRLLYFAYVAHSCDGTAF
jgi:hypothetical protein